MTHRRPPLLLGIRMLRIMWRMLLALAVAANLIFVPWMLGADAGVLAQMQRVALYLSITALASAIIQELLSPNRSQMRWIPVADHRAQRLAAIAKSLLYILFFTETLIYLVEVNEWSDTVAGGLELLRNLGLVAFIGSAISRSGLLERLRPATTTRWIDLLRYLLVRVGFPLLVWSSLFVVVAHALGYRALATFVAMNAAWTLLAILAVAMTYRLLVSRLRTIVLFIQAEGGGEKTEPKPGLIGFERITRAVLLLAALAGGGAAVLGVWGVSVGEFIQAIDRPVLGDAGLRWFGLIKGVLQVAGIFLAGALLRTALVFFVFPGSRLDMGARYAILTLLRYVVGLMAVLIGLNAIGVDGSALAVFAGAATVGLAFGLQDIFANFFSGLIMLVERPLRVGDYVDINGAAGTVDCGAPRCAPWTRP